MMALFAKATLALVAFSSALGLAPTPVKSVGGSAKKSLLRVFQGTQDAVLACPVSREPLVAALRFLGSPTRTLTSESSGTQYRSNALYTDLVPATDSEEGGPLLQLLRRSRAERVQTDLFRSPVVSFLYERGWRQNFDNAGFPGIDTEFEEVRKFFSSARSDVVVDLSCGTGLMSRRLARTGDYARVISADYSESMLTEASRRFDESTLLEDKRPELIRCDSAQLPFQDDSVAALHAGAALHCWPRLEQALTEIYRVLQPGAPFYASTFTNDALISGGANNAGFRLFEIDELRGLMADAGFEDVDVRLEGRACAIVRCKKQPIEQQSDSKSLEHNTVVSGS